MEHNKTKRNRNILLIVLWVIGTILTYFILLSINYEKMYEHSGYYLKLTGIVSVYALLLFACMHIFLFRNTYERVRFTKNIRESNYISAGIDLLNERFILIDVERGKYEFLCVERESEDLTGRGSYDEFVIQLLDTLAKNSDKERFSEIFPLNALTQYLAASNDKLSIPVELEIEGKKQWDLLSFIVIEKKKDCIQKILLSRRDITETQTKALKQQQLLTEALWEAEKANQAKSTFLFNMSHDIRTPMNAIIGFAAMAKKHLDEPKRAEEYLNKVEMSSQHMLQIVNDILDMARIDSGKVELESAPINIYKECYAIDALFRSSMDEKNIDFSVKIDINNDVVLGDAMRIRQVVINLVSNALKYTKPGGKVELRYQETKCEEAGVGCFEISVKDTGIGMSEEYQYHLFEAFERERSAAVSGIQGTGLGLAISKKLADMMGASLVCNSKLGVGTEFILKLKLPIAGYVTEIQKDNRDVSVFKDKRILLVEDNDLNREIAVDMLEELGFIVDKAADGAEAVEKIRTSKSQYYQVVLMDIQMPYMNGYQATSSIRTLKNKSQANIPIIAMTANAFEEDRQKALEAGMNAHLSKPINEKEVIETLSLFM